MKRMSLFVSIILCLTLLLSMGATGVFAAEEGNENFVTNWSMTLNDEIVIKFQIGALPADAVEAVATVGSRSYAAAGDVISVPVYATQMATEITVAAVDGTGAPVASRSFTVREYLQSILGNAAYASYHALAKELLNYANAAQVHFGVNADDLAAVEGAGQTAVPGNASAYAIDDQSDLMDCTGASLVYREKIALRFYFDIDPTGCTFTVNGEAAALTVNEAGKYVEIADILPQNLDQQVVLSVTDAEGRTVSVTYSPLTYIVRMSQKGSDTTKALVKALYNYHLAAKNFVPAQDVKVSFDLGYEGETIADRTIAFGGTYGELPVPADREHYTFEGWTLADGTVVTANTKVTSTHTLYAKWEITPDTSLLKFASNGEAKSSVYREYIDGKETVVFDTAGKILDGHGYGRAVKMTLTDTSKEVIKFRFQFVSCDATAVEKLTMNYTTNVNTDINSGNYGHFVILDENHNIVVEMETGKWYTFYGRTRGYENLYLWPVTNTTEQVNVKMYFQDREVLDYEPEINIRQENTAYQGNTAPYQDKDGNWLVHYRSFTGDIDGAQQHGNTAWTRRTYIDIPSQYSHASFEFRFNVSQYAAAEEELADHIEAFAYLNAEYFDLEGNAVTAAEMKVGQWYKAIFANPIPETGDYFITMGFKDSGSSAIVNIDMDYRNAQGYAFDFDYSFTDGYYVKHANAIIDGMQATKITVANNGDPTQISDRRIVLNLENTADQIISMKMKVTECSGTPSIQITKPSGDRVALVVLDEAGNLADSNNLELNKWYTVRWLANGQAKNEFRFFEGSKTTGVVYIADITISEAENPFTTAEGKASGFYTQVLPYELDGETHYMGYVRPTGDGTNSSHRRAVLSVSSVEKQIISMQVKFTACSATPSLEIRRDDYPANNVDYILVDAEGNVYDGTNLDLNKWYTLMWMSQGNVKYRILPITGSAANGTFIMKNIKVETVTEPFTPGYYVWVAPFAAGNETHYWVRARATGDGTQIGNRYVSLNVNSNAGDVVSFKMKMTQTTGTPDLQIKNAGGTAMDFMISDAEGNVVAPTAMQLGQWYTVSWVSDGSASYNIYSFAGEKANGTYFVKDIKAEQVNVPFTVGSSSTATGYYGKVTPYISGDDVAYKAYYHSTGDGTNEVDRRIYVGVSGDKTQVISMKIYFAACSGTPAVNIRRNDALMVGYAVTDSNGNIADSKNLQLNQWYTVTWIAEHISLTSYRVEPFLGSAANGTFYMKDITVKDSEGPFTGSYYTWAAPLNDGTYMCHTGNTGDGIVHSNRRVDLTVNAASGDTISMKVMMTATSGTPLFTIQNASGATISSVVTDENGNTLDSTAMEMNKWYTISWTADDSASYRVLSFDGSKATGTFIAKDITVE